MFDSADWRFFVSAATAADTIGVAFFNPSSMKLFHIFSVPSNVFVIVYLNPTPHNWFSVGVKLFSF